MSADAKSTIEEFKFNENVKTLFLFPISNPIP